MVPLDRDNTSSFAILESRGPALHRRHHRWPFRFSFFSPTPRSNTNGIFDPEVLCDQTQATFANGEELPDHRARIRLTANEIDYGSYAIPSSAFELRPSRPIKKRRTSTRLGSYSYLLQSYTFRYLYHDDDDDEIRTDAHKHWRSRVQVRLCFEVMQNAFRRGTSRSKSYHLASSPSLHERLWGTSASAGPASWKKLEIIDCSVTHCNKDKQIIFF